MLEKPILLFGVTARKRNLESAARFRAVITQQKDCSSRTAEPNVPVRVVSAIAVAVERLWWPPLLRSGPVRLCLREAQTNELTWMAVRGDDPNSGGHGYPAAQRGCSSGLVRETKKRTAQGGVVPRAVPASVPQPR